MVEKVVVQNQGQQLWIAGRLTALDKSKFCPATIYDVYFLIADVAGCRALGSPRPVPNSGRIEAPCAGAADSNQGFCPGAGALVSPREQN